MSASVAARLTLLLGCWGLVAAGRAEPQFPPPEKGERLVIVAPHPDDEVLGCAGLIQHGKTLIGGKNTFKRSVVRHF